MTSFHQEILAFITHELAKANFSVTQNTQGQQDLDYLLTASTGKVSQLYVRFIDLEQEQALTIRKHDLGELNPNKFFGLVVIDSLKQKTLYLIPSIDIVKPTNKIFYEKNINGMPHLSFWKMKISKLVFIRLQKYKVSNFY